VSGTVDQSTVAESRALKEAVVGWAGLMQTVSEPGLLYKGVPYVAEVQVEFQSKRVGAMRTRALRSWWYEAPEAGLASFARPMRLGQRISVVEK
jgi:hypothetical protein